MKVLGGGMEVCSCRLSGTVVAGGYCSNKSTRVGAELRKVHISSHRRQPHRGLN